MQQNHSQGNKLGGINGESPSTEEWIKKDAVYIYNGILLSHRKEQNNAICSNMDGPRDCHIERSKSEIQISYDIAYMWNPEKMVQIKSLVGQGGRDKLEDWG